MNVFDRIVLDKESFYNWLKTADSINSLRILLKVCDEAEAYELSNLLQKALDERILIDE